MQFTLPPQTVSLQGESTSRLPQPGRLFAVTAFAQRILPSLKSQPQFQQTCMGPASRQPSTTIADCHVAANLWNAVGCASLVLDILFVSSILNLPIGPLADELPISAPKPKRRSEKLNDGWKPTTPHGTLTKYGIGELDSSRQPSGNR
ncbi:hypothetical protein AK830_g12000 [Neonectria ditissima]|uniref:Uncharacterized protein n=1 Tax=Neonectria ditissima TaxID=78410 RepID=A0A0P7B1B6_9HYPO|nr:hypothetical protein AK830_g12000 [Neonectria ditissima]